MNTASYSLSNNRSTRIGVGAMLLGAVLVLAGLISTTSSHENGGNQSCPSGSVLIAKFNYDHGYSFEKPAGNENVVTLTGASASGATWHSTLGVSGVIVKGGPASVFTSFAPPQFDGTFSNGGLPKVGKGDTPDVSNVQFCGPTAQPPSSTSSTSSSTSTSYTTTTYGTTTTTSYGTTTSTPYGTTTSTPYSTTTSTPYGTTTTTTPRETVPTSTTTTTLPKPPPSSTSTTASTTSTTASTTSTTAAPVSSTSTAYGPTSTTRPVSTSTQKVSGTTVKVTTTTQKVIGSGTTVPVVTSTTLIIPTTGSNLPFTGGQSTPLLILGILFLAGGATLTFSNARRGRGARA